jgi:hypothetical protein
MNDAQAWLDGVTTAVQTGLNIGGILRNSNFRRGCFDRAVSSVGLQGACPTS